MPIYGLSYLFPRNKEIWVFGSTFGRRFADSPKYLYLYINHNKTDTVRPIWISKKKELVSFLQKNRLEAYYLYSLKGIWYSLRAKVYLYDNYSKDICYTLSGGAKKINLWHGIPLKKIQKDNRFDRFRNPKNFRAKLYGIPRRISDEKPSDYVLSTSAYLAPIFSSAFHTKRVLISGYPRNDCMVDNNIKVVSTKQERVTLDCIERWKVDKKIALYMPTFRDSEQMFFEVMNVKQFQLFLAREKIVFIVKLHPKSKLNHEFSKLQGENIYIMDQEEDPYPLLIHMDFLVTDYSSIYFDFLLTGKPIIFFPYDLSEYLKASREMYFDYHEFTPGRKVYNGDEMEKALLEEDCYIEDRCRIRDKVFNLDRCNTGSESLFREINKLLYKEGK